MQEGLDNAYWRILRRNYSLIESLLDRGLPANMNLNCYGKFEFKVWGRIITNSKYSLISRDSVHLQVLFNELFVLFSWDAWALA